MSILMKFEGIDGESTLAGKAGFIEVSSLKWGFGRNVSAVRPGARARVEPSVREVVVTKEMDGASVKLIHQALMGGFDRNVELHFLRPGLEGPQEYAKYVLGDCGINTYSVDSSGSSPAEVYSLNFATIQFVYIKFGDDLTGIPSDVAYFLPNSDVT